MRFLSILCLNGHHNSVKESHRRTDFIMSISLRISEIQSLSGAQL